MITTNQNFLKGIILAGGNGTRLWPLSTKESPKQFQKIASDKTMIETTVDRLDFLEKKDIFVALNESHLGLVRSLCPNIPSENLIIEPALRDTASCIGLATALIESESPDEIIAIIYADQLILNKEEFQKKLKVAVEIAEKDNSICIVEVNAESPNTNYGYVKKGEKVDNDKANVYKLGHFTEKPDLETAKEFVNSGNYLWNTGIYVFKASVMMKHFKKIIPHTYEKLKKIVENKNNKDSFTSKLYEIYPTLNKVSLDYAVMEHISPEEVKLIEADNLGWSDIGNWEAIWKLSKKDNNGNYLQGNIKELNCENCFIEGKLDKKILAIGLKDIVVVNTIDGLIVCKKEDSKRIKELL